ncbi:MAG: hypothetical protein M0006_00645 [Magnetospirillum sp.]|nr:hypothetical protein [Magnetospirillum sp.]
MKLGHEKLDADHEAIISLAHDIDRDLTGRCSIEALRTKLNRLYAMLTEHCVFEEDLMDLLPRERYAKEVEDHKRGHDRLLNGFLMLVNFADRTSASAEAVQPHYRLTIDTLAELIIGDSQLLGSLAKEGKISPA